MHDVNIAIMSMIEKIGRIWRGTIRYLSDWSSIRIRTVLANDSAYHAMKPNRGVRARSPNVQMWASQ